MFVRNPFIKKMQPASANERVATYKGIFLKNLWYWALCFLGMLFYYYLPLEFGSIPILATGVILVVICPFIVYLIPSFAFVAGSLYSLLQGYLMILIVGTYTANYAIYVWLAAGMTALISAVLLVLYTQRIIRVNQKFRAIFLSLFIISAIFALMVYVSSFWTNTLTNLFCHDGFLSILAMEGMLIVSVINLVFEFDYTVQIVSEKACKKYEWVAGYGLFMSIIFIFIRVLAIFEKIGRNK